MPTRRANRRRSLRGRCVSLPTSERARTGAEERTVLLRGTLERHLDVVERSRVAKRGGQEGRVPPAHLGRRRLVAVARVVKLDQVLKVTVFGEVAAAGKVAEKAVVAVGPLGVRTPPELRQCRGQEARARNSKTDLPRRTLDHALVERAQVVRWEVVDERHDRLGRDPEVRRVALRRPLALLAVDQGPPARRVGEKAAEDALGGHVAIVDVDGRVWSVDRVHGRVAGGAPRVVVDLGVERSR